MQYAPRPKRQGTLMAAVIEVVVSMGGATRKDVVTYLPTVYDEKFSMRQVESALSNAVTRGYLISDNLSGNRKYRRAPMEYYEARRKVVRAQQRKSRKKSIDKKTRKEVAAIDKATRRQRDALKMASATPKPEKDAPRRLSPEDFDRARVRMAHMVDRETAITWALVTFVGGFGIGLALGSLL